MEQNQKYQQEENQVIQKSKEDEWSKVRNEFANDKESIDQTEDVITLIEKWIWIQYQDEFKQYETKLQERTEKIYSLKQIITDIIQQQKQASWIINQKYSMDQVNQIIVKLRDSIQSILYSKPQLNPQNKLLQSDQLKTNSFKMDPFVNNQVKYQKGSIKIYQNILPEIKPRGKIYNIKQMASSFHLLKETHQDYQIRSPYMFQNNKKAKQYPKDKFGNHKYLKMSFQWFCKQGYNSNGLFDDFSKEADKMTLNKWMIFCKQFDFIDKFPLSELTSIYQTATKFRSVMLFQEFLSGVAILQDKYVNKFNVGQVNFIENILKIGNQAAFKVKMDNLKVSYAGPRRNFFEIATYTEGYRTQQIKKQQIFKAKKKQRQIVLIKGMFQDHLKDEISKLKQQRQVNKMHQLGNSFSMAEAKQKNNAYQNNSYLTTRIKNVNYSKIFQINRRQSLKKDINASRTQDQTSNMYKTESLRKQIQSDNKQIESKTTQNTYKSKLMSSSVLNQGKRKKIESENDTTWLTKIRNDSQQSDEILKEHLKIEDKIKNSLQSNKMKDLMKQMSERSKNVEKIKQQMEKDNQQDDDLIQTQVNFKKM